MSEQTTQQTDQKKEKDKRPKIISGLFISLLILFWIVFNFLAGLIIALAGAVATTKLLEKKPETKKFVPAIFAVLIIAIMGAIFLPAIQQDAKFRNERAENCVPIDDLTTFTCRYGKPDIDENSADEIPQPLIITRRITYIKEQVVATYVPTSNNPPFEKWKLIGFQDTITLESISPSEAVERLKETDSKVN